MAIYMRYIIDIDGTICHERYMPDGIKKDYENHVPIPERIAKVNALYDAGHTIKYMTARGITSGVDYEPLTHRQLMAWGAKYHELSVGKKEHYDIWIDDKAVNSESYFIDCKGETYE